MHGSRRGGLHSCVRGPVYSRGEPGRGGLKGQGEGIRPGTGWDENRE